MVKSKKILCLILAVIILIAVCALCALGVGADDPVYPELSSNFAFAWFGSNTNLVQSGSYPLNFSWNKNGGTITNFCLKPRFPQFQSNTYYLVELYFSLSAEKVTTVSFDHVANSGVTDVEVLVNELSDVTLIYNTYHFVIKLKSGTYSITDLDLRFTCNSFTYSTWWYELGSFISAECISSVPETEPDDEDFTFLEPTYYSYNQKVPSYTNVTEKNNPSYYDWEIPNLHSLTLPTQKQLNEDALFLMFYAGGDYEEFFDPYTVVSGQLQILIENDRYIDLVNSNGDFQGTIESTVSRLIQNGHVWITNHEVDPTNAEFQYFEVPTTWDLRSQLWQYPESRYLTQFVYDFYFVVPDDIATIIGFNPFNIMIYLDPIIQVDSTSISIQNLENYYSFNYYSIRYWHRNSSESPLPDPYTPVDNSEDVQIQDAVDGTSGYKWEYDQTMDYYDPNLEYANDVFDLSSLASTFNTLYSSLIYSGTDFHFYLPTTGVVPFLNVTLWQQTEIPLKYYIDALPNPVIVVIRFLAWGGVAMGFFLTAKTLLSDINGGNKDESSS